jgi:hypothetical protein
MLRIVVLAICLIFTTSVPVFAEHLKAAPHYDDRVTININSNKGGDLSQRGSFKVHKGENIFVQIRPEKGFIIKNVFFDHMSIGPVYEYEFKNIICDHELYVKFEPINKKPKVKSPHS